MYASSRSLPHQPPADPSNDLRRPRPGRVAFQGGHPFDSAAAAEQLLGAQNPDGGWPYLSGQSWTEATALAILALRVSTPAQTQSAPLRAADRGLAWLHRAARADGGFAPALDIAESTWVTSLAYLALVSGEAAKCMENQQRSGPAVTWLLAQKSGRTGGFIGMLQRVLDTPGSHPPPGGAPWFPGTAAWVAPSALRVFALARAAALTGDQNARRAAGEAQSFLLAHRLEDGGWNHGGWYAPSERVSSYPEITGLALLALRGAAPAILNKSTELARASLACPNSLEAWAWLRMGLAAHGQPANNSQPEVLADLPAWTLRELALAMLAAHAGHPSNMFTQVAL